MLFNRIDADSLDSSLFPQQPSRFLRVHTEVDSIRKGFARPLISRLARTSGFGGGVDNFPMWPASGSHAISQLLLYLL
jgi:hypothetical protein